jgi:hypothetical protein
MIQAEQIVREWIGKTVQFPNIDSIMITNETFGSLESKEFKILLYRILVWYVIYFQRINYCFLKN